MATTIITKFGSGAPAASDVVRGELAVDTENGRLYTETSGGSVIEIGLNPSGNVDVTGTVTASDGVFTDGVAGSASVFNEDGTTADFRVESTGNTHMLFVDGGLNRVGIGTASPATNLEVSDDDVEIRLTDTSGGYSDIRYAAGVLQIRADQGDNVGSSSMRFSVDGSEAMRIDSAGNILQQGASPEYHFGTDSASHYNWRIAAQEDVDAGFEIASGTQSAGSGALSDSYTTRLVVKGDTGNVGISTTSPENGVSYNAAARVLGIAGSGAATSAGYGAISLTNNRATPSGSDDLGKISFGSSNDTGPEKAYIYASAVGSGGATGGYGANMIFATRTDNGGLSNNMTLDSSGNVTIGTPPNNDADAQLHVYGLGQTTADLADSGDMGATLRLSDVNTAAGSGGAIVFANNQGDVANSAGFAAIKGLLSNGNTNTIGHIAFSTRNSITDTALTERMRIDSSGNLQVGKTAIDNTSNGFVLDANGTLNIVRSTEYLMRLNRTSTDGEIARFQKDGATVGSIGTTAGDIQIGSGDTALRFQASTDSVFPAQASGGGRGSAIDLGLDSVPFKDLYLSGGVYLGGTAAANKLDDYEEGTFTPGFTGASVASANTAGYYRKIGSLVFVTYYTGAATFSSASGSARLTGLPFTAASSVQLYPVASLSHYTAFATTPVDGYIPLSNTEIHFIQSGTTSGASYVNGTKYFMVSACYIAA